MNPEPQEVNSADLEIEKLAEKDFEEWRKNDSPEVKELFKDTIGMIQLRKEDFIEKWIRGYKASQSKLPVDNGDVDLFQIATQKVAERFGYTSFLKGIQERSSIFNSLTVMQLVHYAMEEYATIKAQSKLTGTVFVKVDCRDGNNLPKKEGAYFVFVEGIEKDEDGNEDTYTNGAYHYFLRTFEGAYFSSLPKNETVIAWLEETAAPKLYSEEQMRKCLDQWNERPSNDMNYEDDITSFLKDFNSLQPKQ